MEDSCCAVCAEVVQWAAYGQCGHLDVCALCIARLRFLCADRRCCICNSLSPLVFFTPALGSLTRVISDFSILPAATKDGKAGSYWFHEGLQAYFDDFDAYKTFKNMCRLSCTVCEKSEADGKQTSKRKSKIKNIEQLKDHLSRQHELFFCSLCLANKKVFICEQKLYSRVQLRQHVRNGDSEVDGFESERCGFSGHPFCDFCQTPFYGDNELYFHMSTEHFTCHICTREHPEQYEYYKDYNDLEIHFRKAHFLCEDAECLDKKFIVFATETDIKRHAASEHGGNMTRSKRNTALQLPHCFRFPERTEEGYRARASSNHISSASSYDASSGEHRALWHNGSSNISLTANPVPSSGHQGTTMDFRSVLLNGPSFPPLPNTSKRRKRKPQKNPQITGQNTVELLHNSSSLPSSSSHSSGSSSSGDGLHSTSAVPPQSKPLTVGHSTSSSSSNPSNHSDVISSGLCSASSPSFSSRSTDHVGSSSSSAAAAFDCVNGGSLDLSASDERCSKGDDVQAANKSLVDNIRAALEFSPDKFASFKIISKKYRDGEIEAGEYLSYVHQFGLQHLILDLATLCPDPRKQKELLEVSESMLGRLNETSLPKEGRKTNGSKKTKKGKEICEDSETSKRNAAPDGLVNDMKELKLSAKPFEERSSSDGADLTVKGKSKVAAVTEMPKILPPECQSKKTKMPKSLASESRIKDVADTEKPEIVLLKDDVGCSNGGSSNYGQSTTAIGGKGKLKKTSNKFLKTRLGETSASMVPNLKLPKLPSDLMVVRPNQDSILASVRGVWRNSGGRRLVTLTEASPCTR
ncbi:hypothetical protein RND81_12G161200 [Saponaria officinalis]|uniref:RING-type domain-containing protein n=1 Tax=Saponaria officinalis TaxID=3572 RepID=A0AAW1HBA5_SAPOF